jgi:hypothetical protein
MGIKFSVSMHAKGKLAFDTFQYRAIFLKKLKHNGQNFIIYLSSIYISEKQCTFSSMRTNLRKVFVQTQR